MKYYMTHVRWDRDLHHDTFLDYASDPWKKKIKEPVPERGVGDWYNPDNPNCFKDHHKAIDRLIDRGLILNGRYPCVISVDDNDKVVKELVRKVF